MNTRRRFHWVFGAALLAAALPGVAQQQRKLRRVAIFGASSQTARPYFDAFRNGMRERGWSDGVNIEYRVVNTEGRMGELDALAMRMVAEEPDVIFASLGQYIRAAQKATRSIPIVMGAGSDVVANGFVQSLARPGGNITGMTTLVEETLAKLFEIMHEILPAAKRIAFLVNETHPSAEVFTRRAQETCNTLGLRMIRVVVNSPDKLEGAFASITANKAQGVVVMPDTVFFVNTKQIVDRLRRAKLPGAFAVREGPVAGGVFSYAGKFLDSYRYAASYVDRILRGAQPRDLPVEQTATYELVVNQKAARELGIRFPQSVLVRADEVLE
jgi:putative ABC transport system substrate-binding protein